MKTFNNPIIPGFYPDPSIIRVEDDYYMVSSSFEFFPAIPVWHSKDLVHWTQIANAIDKEEQGLHLQDVNVSGGVQACTIRYHKGMFYITSTNVGKVWPSNDYNFIICAKNPAGPYSKLHYLEDAPGIDSSLFFDEDGKAYFHANREKDNGRLGDAEIWIQEIDLESMKLVGDKHVLWDGCGGIYPESPHIYKRNGYYYLMIAEGGTGFEHTVTMARSTHIFGPYESSVRNPLLTHKHLRLDYPIQCVGHGDLVETQKGEWFMVCLGCRVIEDPKDTAILKTMYNPLGRETFLVPLTWYDDISPSVSPNSGRVEFQFDFPNLEVHAIQERKDTMDLFALEYRSLKASPSAFLYKKDAQYFLKASAFALDADHAKSVLLRSICAHNFETTLQFEANMQQEDEFGLCLYYNHFSFIRFYISQQADTYILQVVKHFKEEIECIASSVISKPKIRLKIVSEKHQYSFYYNEDVWVELAQGVNGLFLSAAASGGHTGAFVGIYGVSPHFSEMHIQNFTMVEKQDEYSNI